MLYKVIREGNYTSFGGFYGYLFRHCNTLPLSSSLKGIKALNRAMTELFARGEKILIYPEQAMWYNYRKPRPLKSGAFHFAAKSGAPVLPVFITQRDTNRLDADGLPIQAYTVHYLPPLFPDLTKRASVNIRQLSEQNFAAWKECYEREYGIPLTYDTQEDVCDSISL
jgi:1-acyl-sn-glycerol-3-phosphate acyltransferase